MTDTTHNISDLLRSEAEAAEANPDAPAADGTIITHRGKRSRVYSIRLSESEISALEEAAQRTGVPAATLARTWISERLADEEATDLHAIADALATYARRLAAL